MNQAAAQIKDLVLSMTPGARIVAGLLLLVVIVSLGFLFKQGTAEPDNYLFGGEYHSASELVRMEAAIGQAGLNNFKRDGNRLLVPSSKKAEYIAAIRAGDALPLGANNMMIDALKNSSAFDSGTKIREMTKATREAQLGKQLRDMHWIENATVSYDIETKRGMGRRQKGSASVSIMPTAGEYLTTSRSQTIKRFIAGFSRGLIPSDVTVIDLRGDGPGVGGEITAASFANNPYYQVKLNLEQDYRNKIRQLFSNIEGFRIRVTAKLDPTMSKTIRKVTPEGQPKAISTLNHLIKKSNSSPSRGGRPGLEPNGPGGRGRAGEEVAAQLERSETSDKRTDAKNVVGAIDQTTQSAAYTPQEVSALITIPRSYARKKWLLYNPTPEGEDEKEPTQTELGVVEADIIKEIVKGVTRLLPRLSLGQNEESLVEVMFIDSFLPDPPEPQPMSEKAISWLSANMNSLMMAGLTMFSLILLKGMVKASGDPDNELAMPELALNMEGFDSETTAHGPNGNNPAADGADRPKLKLRKGDSLKDDLSDIVRDDPEAAAAILRQWISNAG